MPNLTVVRVYPQIGHGSNYLQSLANLSKSSTAALLRLLQSRSQNNANYALLQAMFTCIMSHGYIYALVNAGCRLLPRHCP